MTKRHPHFTGLAGFLAAGLLTLPLLTACSGSDDQPDASSHISRADTYTSQGQYRSAILEIRNAIKLEPDNLSHTLDLAELYIDIGAAPQAANLLEQRLGEAPEQVTLPLARAYLKQRKHLSAQEVIAGFTPTSSAGQLQANLIKAEIQRLAGNPTEAAALFESLVTAHPSNLEAAEGLLKARLDLRQNQQAIQFADEWLSANPDTPEILFFKGIAHYRSNQLEQATESLTSAVTLIPDGDVLLPIRKSALQALSRTLTEQGRITEAQVYTKLLAQHSDTAAQEQTRAAIAAIEEGRIDEAKQILKDLLKLSPNNTRLALLLGTLEAETGDLSEGARLFAENLDPEVSPTPFIQAATMTRIDRGEREEALKILERAMAARPNDNDLVAMHGVVALSLPQHQQAGEASLSKAIANEPDRVRLRLALARHYMAKNQIQQALGQLRMAFTTEPTDWAATSTYLRLLLETQEKQEAAEIRDSLLNGYPDHPEAVILASLADLYLGEEQQAQSRLETLVSGNPDLVNAKIALANLYAHLGETEKGITIYLDIARRTPDSIQPLQRAAQFYLRDHSQSDLKSWLETLSQDYPELRPNADALGALIRLRQGDVTRARQQLAPHLGSGSEAIKQVESQLLAAESRHAAESEQWELALAKASEARALEPTSMKYALLPVHILHRQGKTDEAIRTLDAVEAALGSHSLSTQARARLMADREGVNKAYRFLLTNWEKTADPELMPSLLTYARSAAPQDMDRLTLEWRQSAPNSVPALLARGDWLLSSGSEDAAAEHYQRILDLQSNHIVALNNLAWLLRERDSRKALELAERASALAPDNAAVLDTYAWLLHLSGDQARAREIIERAYALAPENEEIQSHRNQIKQQM